MRLRLLLVLGLVSSAVGQTAPMHPVHVAQAGGAKAGIRFEDATAKAGIDFTHSFGSAKLGSLLEGTGSGCIWFDYNNDGLPDLYVLSGRPLDDSMHPYPLKEKPATPPHNHLYRNNGDGTFTDVTEKAGASRSFRAGRFLSALWLLYPVCSSFLQAQKCLCWGGLGGILRQGPEIRKTHARSCNRWRRPRGADERLVSEEEAGRALPRHHLRGVQPGRRQDSDP